MLTPILLGIVDLAVALAVSEGVLDDGFVSVASFSFRGFVPVPELIRGVLTELTRLVIPGFAESAIPALPESLDLIEFGGFALASRERGSRLDPLLVGEREPLAPSK